MAFTHASRKETARIDAAIKSNTSWEDFSTTNPTVNRARWNRRAQHLKRPADRQVSASLGAAPEISALPAASDSGRPDDARFAGEAEAAADFTPGPTAGQPVLTAPERGTFILCLHDLRAGQQTICGGINEFRQQCQNLVSQVIETMTPYVLRGGVDRLVVLFGGDILDRPGRHPGRNAAALDALMNSAASVLSCDLLAVLARQFPNLEIVTELTVGDQGRIGPRKQGHYFGNNADKFIYDGIMRRFYDCPEAAPNLTMIEPKNWHVFFDVYGHTVFAEHGDKAPRKGSSALTALRRHEELRHLVAGGIDLYIMGHLPATVCAAGGHGHVIVNGTGRETSGATTQTLLYVTPENPLDTSFYLNLVSKQEQDQPEARDAKTVQRADAA